MKIVRIAAAAALVCTPAFATTSRPPAQASMQQQIDTLKQQVAALQQQVSHLKATRTQQVCISLWCA
jgi:polyhydroxyalkanoate synthesis regulator protein